MTTSATGYSKQVLENWGKERNIVISTDSSAINFHSDKGDFTITYCDHFKNFQIVGSYGQKTRFLPHTYNNAFDSFDTCLRIINDFIKN